MKLIKYTPVKRLSTFSEFYKIGSKEVVCVSTKGTFPGKLVLQMLI